METFLKERVPEVCVERETVPQVAAERILSLRKWRDHEAAGGGNGNGETPNLVFVTGSFFLLREIYGLFRA